MSQLFLSKVALRRDSLDVAPLIAVLQPTDDGRRTAVEHKMLWSLLPGGANPKSDQAKGDASPFLWRKTSDDGRYLILGPRLRGDSPLFEVEERAFEPTFKAGDRVAFDMRLNATKNSTVGRDKKGMSICKRIDVALEAMKKLEESGERDPSKRHEYKMDVATQAVRTWFETRGQANGYEVETIVLDNYRTAVVDRSEHAYRSDVRFGVFDVAGVLTVVDPVLFMQRVAAGFGRAKAFGCGLMLLRKAPQA